MSMLRMPAGVVSLRIAALGGLLAIGLQASEWTEKQDQARGAMEARDFDAAAQLSGDSLSLAPGGPDHIAALASYGIALNRAGRNLEAKPVLEQALAGGADRQSTSVALASADRYLGDYRSAERVLRAAVRDTSGAAPGRVELMINLVDLLREQARFREADSILSDAAALPDLPRESRIGILVERAELHRDMREWTESIADWNEIGRIAETQRSPLLEEIYTGGLGETWMAVGDTARAEPLLRRSLDLLRKDRSSTSSQIAMALALVASAYTAENKLALASEALDEAISRDEVCLGGAHPQVAMMLELRAAILSRRGEAEAARDDLDRARSIMTAHFGAESTAVAGVDAALGEVEDRASRPDRAAAAYGDALTLLHKAGAGERIGEELTRRYAAALKAAHRRNAALTFAEAQ